MATRSTDVALLQQCPGRWTLTNFYEDSQAEASFFILGSLLHATIEVAINMDLDQDWALQHYGAALDAELERIQCSFCSGIGGFQGPVDNMDIDFCPSCGGTGYAKRIIESSKRGFDTLREDGERMLRNWFRSVHPDSAKRHPIYDDYEWPPKTEVPFLRRATRAGTKYPVWGKIDALFIRRGGVGASAGGMVDWKSGTSRQRSDDQLDHYRFGSRWYVDAWFHHLDKVRNSAVIQMADPYPGDEVIRQRILETEAAKERIVAGHMPDFNPGFLCNYCPVQQFCPVDGDVRDRPENRRKLESMLCLAKPLESIERVA